MPEFDPVTGRITLTKAHIASEHGKRLIQLILEIGLDGELSENELTKLGFWLQTAPSEIPAIRHLRELIVEAQIDGVISADERKILHKQIERALPPTERERLVIARKAFEEKRRAEQQAQAKREKEERERLREEESATRDKEREERFREYNKATEAQRRYVKGLGGSLSENATKSEASEVIERLLHSNGSITPRQQMVLRFWDVRVESAWGKSQVSVWMDEWYDKDPDHQLAWELFKEESGDAGLSRDPQRVPIGIGHTYLLKIKNGTRKVAVAGSGVSRGAQQRSAQGVIIFGISLIVLLVILGSCIKK